MFIRSNTHFSLLIILALCISLLGNALIVTPVQAATFTVTKTADTNDSVCDADCSLREAITAANAAPGADTITVPAGTYTLTLGSQLPVVTTTMTITGSGEANTYLEANAVAGTATYRILQVSSSGILTLNHLTMRNGVCAGACAAPTSTGGGIQNTGALTVSDVTFSANSTSMFGGGMSNESSGTTTLTNVTFSANSSSSKGGGLYNGSSNPTLTNVTFINNTSTMYGGGMSNWHSSPILTNVAFSNNTASNSGGGMYNENSSSPTLMDVTFTSNTALNGGGMFNTASNAALTNVTFNANSATRAISGNGGGGMYNYLSNTSLINVTFSANSAVNTGGGMINNASGPTLTNVTFSGNSAITGGGMYNTGSSPTLKNVIIANSTTGGDCSGIINATSSNNLIENAAFACGLTNDTNENIIGFDPNLDTLQDNGGHTTTHALLSPSPAIDAGTTCPTPTDQRGLTRPQDGDGNSSAICDIGAYEYASPPAISGLSLDIGPIGGGSTVVITGTTLTGGTVTFGGTAATCTVDSDTQITCTTPAHAAGTVNVVVTTPGGSATSTGSFTYVGAVHSISPNFGPIAGGTTVTITDSTGPDFSGATSVTFGGTPAASLIVNSATQITMMTPAHASGMVDVVVYAPAGPYTYLANFTYYGSDIPLAPVSVPATGSTLPFSQSPIQLQVGFNVDVLHVDAADPNWDSSAINPSNYLLTSAGSNGVIVTQTCLAGIQPGDGPIPINNVEYNAASHTATLNINNDQPLPVGHYQLLACGTTSIEDLNGVELNAGLQDTRFTLEINADPAAILPDTGFAQDRMTILPKQNVPYAGFNDLQLEIPALDVHMNIVGVPQTGDSWDVSWLGNDAGYLAGSAYPTWIGNSVLTGHVWDARNQPGPFVNLDKLKYGDLIKIHAFGQVYTYEVRDNRLVRPGNIKGVMKHEELSWVTLLTCESYNADLGKYAYRRMVRAVWVSLE